MHIEKANKILSRIKFLHYKFRLKKGYDNYCFLEILLKTPDTRNRTQLIDLVHQHSISLDYINNEEIFIRVIFEKVLSVLKHEAAELFLVDDKAPFDEHNENTDKFEFLKAMFTPEENRMYEQMENFCRYK